MPNQYNLSEGTLQIIMKGGTVENPTMQVLGSKKINSGNADKERYRILLSDGKHTISFAMFTTQSNDAIGQAGLENFSVIQIKKYITSVINNTGKGDARVLLILEMELLHHGQEVGYKIGNPTALSDAVDDRKTIGSSIVSSSTSLGNNSTNVNSFLAKTNQSTSLDHQLTHPISSLSPYHNRVVIPMEGSVSLEVAGPANNVQFEIWAMLNRVMTEVSQISKQNAEYRTQLENMKRESYQRDQEWARERESLMTMLGNLEETLESCEKKNRRNNVTVSGKVNVPLQAGELKKSMSDFFQSELGMNVCVKDAVVRSDDQEKVVMVEFNDWDDKQRIIRSAKKLTGKGIFITPDFTRKGAKIQQIIRQRSRAERQKGVVTKVGYGKLKIGNTWYVWDDKSKSLVPKQ